ncbi:hypothetical protein [Paraclostridium sordellii]|nr:hypothetical protein [Paeniclostridium sordellii]CEP43702.1 Uncharacterised protein [[Clostridium] sordellii] [Paeniclostridium sordellii]CEP50454.1 Uncharacterised protein [[Clostridium] sordellii] [Paeniclostridium sordellii]
MYDIEELLNLLDKNNEDIYRIRKVLNELEILEVVESKVQELE